MKSFVLNLFWCTFHSRDGIWTMTSRYWVKSILFRQVHYISPLLVYFSPCMSIFNRFYVFFIVLLSFTVLSDTKFAKGIDSAVKVLINVSFQNIFSVPFICGTAFFVTKNNMRSIAIST